MNRSYKSTTYADSVFELVDLSSLVTHIAVSSSETYRFSDLSIYLTALSYFSDARNSVVYEELSFVDSLSLTALTSYYDVMQCRGLKQTVKHISQQNNVALLLTVTLTFDLSTPKPQHSQDHSLPSLNTSAWSKQSNFNNLNKKTCAST